MVPVVDQDLYLCAFTFVNTKGKPARRLKSLRGMDKTWPEFVKGAGLDMEKEKSVDEALWANTINDFATAKATNFALNLRVS